MKTEELMIGDFVNFHLEIFSTDYEGIETVHDEVLEIGKVSALNSIGNVWVIDSEGEEHQVTKYEIEPIPLTKEVLEKNGFIGKVYLWIDVGDEKTLIYYPFEHRLTLQYRNKCEILFRCQCFSVHEFQHALKLCGIEKEIMV